MKRALAVVVAVLVVFTAGCFLAVTPDGSLAIGIAPTLAYIPGTSIQTVASAPGVFYQGGYYWRHHNGMWWRSSYWNRGWIVHHSVPAAFLRIPSSHPSYRYVKYHPGYRGRVIRSHGSTKRVVPTVRATPSRRVVPSRTSPKKAVPRKKNTSGKRVVP